MKGIRGERRGRKALSESIVQFVADPTALTFGRLQHFALEFCPLRFVRPHTRPHCGKGSGQLCNLIPSPQWLNISVLARPKRPHLARQASDAPGKAKMQCGPKREAKQRHRGGNPPELPSRVILRRSDGPSTVEDNEHPRIFVRDRVSTKQTR